jgi:hypothetical protein
MASRRRSPTRGRDHLRQSAVIRLNGWTPAEMALWKSARHVTLLEPPKEDKEKKDDADPR